jgi:uncharacterized iron-regulated protein
MKAIHYLISLFFLSSINAEAQLYKASTQEVASVEALVGTLQKGDVLVLGEYHDQRPHHLNHEAILNELLAQGLSFDVGMEFFYDYRLQSVVDQFLFDQIDEETFLKQIQWGEDNFDFYRPKILAPLETGGKTFAINAPRELTRAVSRQGLSALSPELKALLPPDFALGNSQYFQRFKDAVGGDHFPEDQLHNYFAAQSIWDDTMAWQSILNFNSSSSDVFVIVVGDFHVSYGGGLPDRLIARGAKRVVTLSQMDVTEVPEKDRGALLIPHPDWGSRADWIWLTENKE